MSRPPLPSGQRLATALRQPVVRYRRWRWSGADPRARGLMEAVGYRRSMEEFMAAMALNPGVLLDADLDETSTVVDAGAFIGEWAGAIEQRYGASVIAFEPGPMYVAEMRRRLGDGTKVRIVPVGLGARDQRASLELEGPGSRVVDTHGSDDAAEIEIRDVAAVLSELGVERIDLLKVNIEGGEYDVLDRLADTGWLERVDDLLVQFHEWYPGAPGRRRRIRRRLAETHDEVWDYPWVWERWTRRGRTPSSG